MAKYTGRERKTAQEKGGKITQVVLLMNARKNERNKEGKWEREERK